MGSPQCGPRGDNKRMGSAPASPAEKLAKMAIKSFNLTKCVSRGADDVIEVLCLLGEGNHKSPTAFAVRDETEKQTQSQISHSKIPNIPFNPTTCEPGAQNDRIEVLCCNGRARLRPGHGGKADKTRLQAMAVTEHGPSVGGTNFRGHTSGLACAGGGDGV